MSLPKEGFGPVKRACQVVASVLANEKVIRKFNYTVDDAEISILAPDGINSDYQLHVDYMHRGDRKIVLHTQVPTSGALIEALEACVDPHGKGRV
jgi:hypothetical protein